uniref:Uncharacterized protein n=1 Tax=Fopius arisanus TaxID=64838 RepID=A0A0C9QJ67_9HYME
MPRATTESPQLLFYPPSNLQCLHTIVDIPSAILVNHPGAPMCACVPHLFVFPPKRLELILPEIYNEVPVFNWRSTPLIFSLIAAWSQKYYSLSRFSAEF